MLLYYAALVIETIGELCVMGLSFWLEVKRQLCECDKSHFVVAPTARSFLCCGCLKIGNMVIQRHDHNHDFSDIWRNKYMRR